MTPASSGHRKKVLHYQNPGDLHELTFSCYQRLALLTNDAWMKMLSRRIDEANREEAIELVAFVYMPEHVHLLVYPIVPKPSIDRYLARIKQPFSKEIKQILIASGSPLVKRLTVRERPGKYCFRFWQEGPGFDRNLFTPEAGGKADGKGTGRASGTRTPARGLPLTVPPRRNPTHAVVRLRC